MHRAFNRNNTGPPGVIRCLGKGHAELGATHMTLYGNLSNEEAVDKVWELVDAIGVCMLVTWDGERQRSRPVAARPNRERHAIYFLTDEASAKKDQIHRFPQVSLNFADHQSNNYLAISGWADVADDRIMIQEIFSVADRAWWASPDDPAIRLITVQPEDAEIWGGLGRLRAAVALLKAAISGANPRLGDSRKVSGL